MPAQGKQIVREIAISEFRTKGLSLLEEVNRTRIHLCVTRRGKPIAEVIPVSSQYRRDWIGLHVGQY